MIFPARPTCHDGEINPGFFAGDREIVWRAPRSPEPYRCCFYCGSIHPEDLLAALKAGAALHGSDWKYGWPHKFYVDLPNTVNPDELVEMGGVSQGFDEPCPKCCGPDGEPRPDLLAAEVDACTCHGTYRRVDYTPTMGKRETFHTKWYNQHLEDAGLDEEAFAELTKILGEHSGIQFSWGEKDGKRVLRYVAPRDGYQR